MNDEARHLLERHTLKEDAVCPIEEKSKGNTQGVMCIEVLNRGALQGGGAAERRPDGPLNTPGRSTAKCLRQRPMLAARLRIGGNAKALCWRIGRTGPWRPPALLPQTAEGKSATGLSQGATP